MICERDCWVRLSQVMLHLCGVKFCNRVCKGRVGLVAHQRTHSQSLAKRARISWFIILHAYSPYHPHEFVFYVLFSILSSVGHSGDCMLPPTHGPPVLFPRVYTGSKVRGCRPPSAPRKPSVAHAVLRCQLFWFYSFSRLFIYFFRAGVWWHLSLRQAYPNTDTSQPYIYIY